MPNRHRRRLRTSGTRGASSAGSGGGSDAAPTGARRACVLMKNLQSQQVTFEPIFTQSVRTDTVSDESARSAERVIPRPTRCRGQDPFHPSLRHNPIRWRRVGSRRREQRSRRSGVAGTDTLVGRGAGRPGPARLHRRGHRLCHRRRAVRLGRDHLRTGEGRQAASKTSCAP